MKLLLAQAISEGMPLMTADAAIAQYPAEVILVGK